MPLSLAFSPQTIYKGFGPNNEPLVGAKLHTYLAGSLTEEDTYKNFDGTVNSNPITLNDRGEAIVILDTTKAYKFILKDINGVPVPGRTEDNITAGTGGGNISSSFLVKASALDAVAGYLNTKMVAGQNTTIEYFDGGDGGDSLVISSGDSHVSVDGVEEPGYLQNVVEAGTGMEISQDPTSKKLKFSNTVVNEGKVKVT